MKSYIARLSCSLLSNSLFLPTLSLFLPLSIPSSLSSLSLSLSWSLPLPASITPSLALLSLSFSPSSSLSLPLPFLPLSPSSSFYLSPEGKVQEPLIWSGVFSLRLRNPEMGRALQLVWVKYFRGYGSYPCLFFSL